MILFSSVMIDGSESFGIKASIEEKDNLNHLWKCVSFYLGLKTDYLPKDYWEEVSTRHFIAATQINKNPKGIKLANYLVDNLANPELKRSLIKWVSPSTVDCAELDKSSRWIWTIVTEFMCFISWFFFKIQIWMPASKKIFQDISPVVISICAALSGTPILHNFNFNFKLAKNRMTKMCPFT